MQGVALPLAGTVSDRALPDTQRQHRRIRWLAVMVSSILFLKFAAYGLWVTPLWDTPDEPGHFSFALDLSRGHYPVLGQSTLDEEVMDSVGTTVASNYIAQHPPLYYALAAPIVAIAQAAHSDLEQQVRATRITSALFGALAVLGMILLVNEATQTPLLGLAAGITVSATPTFLQLSTGVNHDTLVACTSAWGAYWCVRWLASNSLPDALYCGSFIGLTLITKYTALAVAIPLFFAMAYRVWILRNEWRVQTCIGHTLLLWSAMFLPISIWMLRNLFVHGQLMTASSPGEAPVAIGFFEYMQSAPLWQSTLQHYVGLIGYAGRPGGVSFVQATGTVLQYHLGLILFLSTAAAAAPIVRSERARLALISLIALATILVVFALEQQTLLTATCLGLSLAVATNLIARLPRLLKGDHQSWLIATSALVVGTFALAFYYQLWSTYIGSMRAVQGRYFYPALPFLAVILLWPMRREPWPMVMVLGSLASMVLCDQYFLHYAFKLYQQL